MSTEQPKVEAPKQEGPIEAPKLEELKKVAVWQRINPPAMGIFYIFGSIVYLTTIITTIVIPYAHIWGAVILILLVVMHFGLVACFVYLGRTKPHSFVHWMTQPVLLGCVVISFYVASTSFKKEEVFNQVIGWLSVTGGVAWASVYVWAVKIQNELLWKIVKRFSEDHNQHSVNVTIIANAVTSLAESGLEERKARIGFDNDNKTHSDLMIEFLARSLAKKLDMDLAELIPESLLKDIQKREEAKQDQPEKT